MTESTTITDRQIGTVRMSVTRMGSIAVCESTPAFFGECMIYVGYGHSSVIAALKELEKLTEVKSIK